MTFTEAKKLLDPNNAIQIGKILKPHGYKGQVYIHFKFDPENFEEESVFIRINGWLIPFFVDFENSNLYAARPFIKFKEINDEEQAHYLSHNAILLPRETAAKYIDLNSIDNLIGYVLEDLTSGKCGEITEFEDIPKNPLIKVNIDSQEYLVPVNAIEVVNTDEKGRRVKVRLPQGLLN